MEDVAEYKTKKSSDSELIDFCIDLETLGTGHDAAVIEIAVVPFRLDGFKISREDIGEPFDVFIDPTEYLFNKNFSITQDTIEWWQGNKASQLMKYSIDNIGTTLTTAVRKLVYYLDDNLCAKGVTPRLWCQGTDFDIPILKHLLLSEGYDFDSFIKHTQLRDARTMIFQCVEAVKGGYVENPYSLLVPFEPTGDEADMPHMALYDASRTANNLQQVYKMVKKRAYY